MFLFSHVVSRALYSAKARACQPVWMISWTESLRSYRFLTMGFLSENIHKTTVSESLITAVSSSVLYLNPKTV